MRQQIRIRYGKKQKSLSAEISVRFLLAKKNNLNKFTQTRQKLCKHTFQSPAQLKVPLSLGICNVRPKNRVHSDPWLIEFNEKRN